MMGGEHYLKKLYWLPFENLEEKGDLINQLISDKGVCRTAPTTPGLLNKYYYFVLSLQTIDISILE